MQHAAPPLGRPRPLVWPITRSVVPRRVPRLLVLHCPAGGGHQAAARAVAEAARRRGAEPLVVDALSLTPPWFARAYVGAHLASTAHAPALYGRAFDAMNHRNPLADGLRGALDRAAGIALARFVLSQRPDAVIATHFFPLSVLGPLRKHGLLTAPLIGVVTDYAAHALWAEPFVDVFCSPSGAAERDLIHHGAPEARIAATGIPIRGAFGSIAPLTAPREGEPLRVLVTSGGFGIGPMDEVLRSFAAVAKVKLVVVCGDSARRVEEARRTAASAGLDAEIVGLEGDMPRRMAEAHVLVGKPGGLTSSEALAAGRPMVIVGACPGQETLNERWMVDSGAAISSRAAQAGPACARLRDASRLEAMAGRARAIASPDAALRVVDVALQTIAASGRRRAA